MSYTFTNEGIRLSYLLNHPTWNKIYDILHVYFYYKNYNMYLRSKILDIIADDFYNDFRLKNKKYIQDIEITKWLIRKMDFDDMPLTDLDKRKLRR